MKTVCMDKSATKKKKRIQQKLDSKARRINPSIQEGFTCKKHTVKVFTSKKRRDGVKDRERM